MRVGTVVQRRRAQICARLHAVQTAYRCAEWVDCSSHTCRRSGFVPHRRLRRERVSFSQMLADSGSRYDVDGPALSHALIQRARKRDSQQVRGHRRPLCQARQRPLDQLRVARYAMYVMDYGASGGWRLALNHPERVMGLIKRDLPDVELHLLDTGLRPGGLG